MENFVRGEQAKEIKMTNKNVLIRFVDVPYEESKIILAGKKGQEMEVRDIMKYNGLHPSIGEIVALSEKAKAKGYNEGDIVILPRSVAMSIHNNRIDPIRIDDEVVFCITYYDITAVVNYYRDKVRNGQIKK